MKSEFGESSVKCVFRSESVIKSDSGKSVVKSELEGHGKSNVNSTPGVRSQSFSVSKRLSISPSMRIGQCLWPSFSLWVVSSGPNL